MQHTFSKLIVVSTILVSSQIAIAKKGPNYPEGFKPKTANGIVFTENKGQVHDQNSQPRPDVLFGAMAGNMAFHLKTTGVSYQLTRVDKWKEVEDEHTSTGSVSTEKRKEIEQQTIYRVDLNWVNAKTGLTKTTDRTLEACANYYTEGCPEGGALNVKSYSGVTLHNLYNGINLHYYEKKGQLKHDYIVAPHSDYKQIQLKVEGANVSINKDGSLLLTTPLGKIQEGAPIVYQNGKTLKAKWKVTNNTLSFEIENYNANLELIIDPVTRIWGTYYGGTTDESALSCASNSTGDVYIAGITDSNTGTVIATIGAHQTVFGGNLDAFLIKFNSSGIRLWGTYYGGSGNDEGNACTTDAMGNAYLAGLTSSSTGTVIATAGAHQSVYDGIIYDAFLVKFNSSGVRQWGTYYGGNGNDQGYSCTTDATGNVYLSGYTNSNTGTLIATAGSHQTAFGGDYDAFLVKFNSSGVRQWGTYYGGSGFEQGRSCSTDSNGNVYLAGRTDSNTGTVIATVGSHQPVNNGSRDAFLVKFDANGVRQWATYYGGTLDDYGHSCATDGTGNVYLSGYTDSNSGTLIATPASHQTLNGGGDDAFLVKFNSSGVRQWGTYYGGSGLEIGYSCATDAIGNVYLSGVTASGTGTVIATTGAHQALSGGSYDSFLVKFNSIGQRQWGTYYGGTGNDYGNSCASDGLGNVFLAGDTPLNSGTVIATVGSHQTTFGGGFWDVFLVKFSDCVSLNPNAGTSALCAGATIELTVGISGTATPTYSWAGPNSFTSAVQVATIANASTVNIGTYTVTITNGACIETRTVAINALNPSPTVAALSNLTLCLGNNFTLTPNGGSSYTVGQGISMPASFITSIIITPTAGLSIFTVSASNSLSCVGSRTFHTIVNPKPPVMVASSTTLICIGESATLSASGALSYTWNPGGTGSSIVISPSVTSSYTVTGIDGNGCQNTAVLTQSVDACAGLSENQNSNNQLLVYPNPFNHKITIVSNGGKQNVQVYNILGLLVHDTTIENEKIEIDLTTEANGIYFVRVGNFTEKIIKE